MLPPYATRSSRNATTTQHPTIVNRTGRLIIGSLPVRPESPAIRSAPKARSGDAAIGGDAIRPAGVEPKRPVGGNAASEEEHEEAGSENHGEDGDRHRWLRGPWSRSGRRLLIGMADSLPPLSRVWLCGDRPTATARGPSRPGPRAYATGRPPPDQGQGPFRSTSTFGPADER